MTVQLSHDEAEKKIKDIEGARDRAVNTLQRLNATQDGMVRSGWRGGSATTYARTSDEQNDQFHGIIQTLNHVVDLGSHHMRSVAAADGNS
jgi:uncharacterized protein YukE